MAKKTVKTVQLDTDTVNLLVRIHNVGAHCEQAGVKALAYTTAAVKGSSVGAVNGFKLGWNYSKIGY